MQSHSLLGSMAAVTGRPISNNHSVSKERWIGRKGQGLPNTSSNAFEYAPQVSKPQMPIRREEGRS